MGNDSDTRLQVLEEKVDALLQSAEKIRKLFLITVWVTVAVVVLPLIVAAFILPSLLDSYLSTYQGLL